MKIRSVHLCFWLLSCLAGHSLAQGLPAMPVHVAAATAAASWDFVAQGNQNYYYIDPDSVKEEGGHKSAWTLVDHRQVQTLKDGSHYRSTHGQVQVHCKDKRARLVHLRFFSGPMMSGAVVQQRGMLQDWLEIEPGSPIQRLAYRVC